MIKKVIKQLDFHMDKLHPDFRGKFFINRKNMLIHVGLDTCIFEYPEYRLYLWDAENFLKKNLKTRKFQFYRVPTLINCTKWKFDYVIARKMTTN